jgi:UDPglucose 6-dehydrogenase
MRRKEDQFKRVSVIGLGFVGLSTAVYLAGQGYDVVASSNEKQKVDMINKGKVPFFEPEIEQMLRKALKNHKIRVVVGRETAILETDITIVTVGTPSLPGGSADLTFIKSTAKEIGIVLKKKKGYHLIVIKSTVPPTTTEKVVKTIIERYSGKKVGKDFGLTMSPEFLREGSALYDVANPHRVVIGEFDRRSGDLLERLSKNLYGNKVPVLRMSLASAELSKYASNAFLATKISFINQIANICEKIPGVDVVEIARAMGLDHRIGPEFLCAGAGWGGSCFPKDTKALVALSKERAYEPKLVEEVISVNTLQAKHIVELAEEELGNLNGKKIAVLGLSFKPNTNDIRDAPSLKIIEFLLAKGAKIAAYDPMAMANVRKLVGDKIEYCKDVHECLSKTDCCLVITEWDEFKKLHPSDFIELMRHPIVVDGRRIYNPRVFLRKLRLRSVGLGKTRQPQKTLAQ